MLGECSSQFTCVLVILVNTLCIYWKLGTEGKKGREEKGKKKDGRRVVLGGT